MLRVNVEVEYSGFSLSADLTAAQGDFWGLVGSSGSGKSTLLASVGGLVQPRRGEVALGDRLFFRRREGERRVWMPLSRRRVGYLSQENDLFPHLTVRQNLAYGVTDDGHLAELVSLLELGDLLDRRPTDLSGGQKSRVALGRTLAVQPRLLLLDEPFAALDWSLRRRLGDLLHRLKERYRCTVLMATHDLEELPRLCSHVAVLDGGRVLQAGEVAGVLAAPAGAAAAAALGYHLLPVEVPAAGWIKIGPQTMPYPSAREPGKAVLAFHPAGLRVRSRSGGPADTVITGRVNVAVGFAGTGWCRLALHGGGEVVLETTPEIASNGTEVAVGMGEAFLFPD